MSLTTFQQTLAFFNHPSLQNLSPCDEPFGDIHEILTHIYAQSYFNVQHMFHDVSPTVKRHVLLHHELIPNASIAPIVRHNQNQHLSWTTEELNLLPSMFNTFDLFDNKIISTYHTSLQKHFESTGEYHPIIWELPLDILKSLHQQFPELLTVDRLLEVFSPSIIELLQRYEHDALNTLLFFGGKEWKMWSRIERLYQNNTYLPIDAILMSVEDVPLNILFETQNMDFDQLTTAQTISILKKLNDSGEEKFTAQCIEHGLPLFSCSFEELATIMDSKLLLLLISEIFPTKSDLHPENLSWILKHVPEDSIFRTACDLLRHYETLQNAFDDYEIGLIDSDLYWTITLCHLMELSRIQNKDLMLDMLYGMNYQKYFDMLTCKSTVMLTDYWETHIVKTGLLKTNLQLPQKMLSDDLHHTEVALIY